MEQREEGRSYGPDFDNATPAQLLPVPLPLSFVPLQLSFVPLPQFPSLSPDSALPMHSQFQLWPVLSASLSAHLAAHLFAPFTPRWRRKNSELGSKERVMRMSSLACLSVEDKFAAGAAREAVAKAGWGCAREQEGGMTGALMRNFMAGNFRVRNEITNFFQQLPCNSSRGGGIQRPGRGRGTAAAKWEGSFQVTPVSRSKEKLERKAVDERRDKAIRTSKHLLAGAIAAMVSRTIVAPLERLKLEYLVRGAEGDVIATLRAIFMREGVKGFWKGNAVNLLRTAPFKSINFFAYDNYRSQLLKWGDRTEVTNIERLAAGAAAGVTATMLCFPMDTVRTLMVAPGGDALGGLIGCFQHVLRTEGCLGLYKGLLPAVVSMAPSGAVFYGVYDMLKSAYLNSPKGKDMVRERCRRAEEKPEEAGTQLELGPFRTLLFGALAGACAETVTYPFEVVRRAQQMQHAGNSLGMIGTMQGLLTKGGVRAFYSGVLPSTMQVLPSAALTYFVYESVKIAFKIP